MEIIDKVKKVEEYFGIKIPTVESRGTTYLASGSGKILFDFIREDFYTFGYNARFGTFKDEKCLIIFTKNGTDLVGMPLKDSRQSAIKTLTLLYDFIIIVEKE